MSRTFDALDLSVSRGAARFDLLAGSPVQIDPTRFDRHKPGEHLYGFYGSLKNIFHGMSVEPYLLFKQNLSVTSEIGLVGDALVASPGVRVLVKHLAGSITLQNTSASTGITPLIAYPPVQLAACSAGQ
jgi:hypothetical protein